MSNQKQQMMEVLRSTPVASLAELPQVEDRYVQLVMHTQGKPKGIAETIFHSEKFHFLKVIHENPALKECDQLSIYGCFMDMAVNGLSFDPTKKLCYVVPANVNLASKGQTPQWQKRAKLEVSPYGELAIRQMIGQIEYADNPVIVYEGDEFKPMISGGKKTVQYACNYKHSNVIIGSFIRIVRIDGQEDFHWLLREDIERLRGYSERKNNGKANALYTSGNGQIDPGFLAAKTIKHAFKSYPKVSPRGKFVEIAPEPEELPENIYGFDVDETTEEATPVVVQQERHADFAHTVEVKEEPATIIENDDEGF